MERDRNRFRGCLLGLAAGDAVGTTVEFQVRGSFPPITDIVGGGPFGLKAGQWTDDTSMALCLATSLISKDGFDPPADQMDRYWDWYRNGYLSSTGHFFDIGNTVRHALEIYKQTGDPFGGSTDAYSAGNGSLMRLAPIPLFYFPNLEDILYWAGESSRTTHGAVECVEASLWCFYHTDTFETAILQAANLGDDADTTAAICGQSPALTMGNQEFLQTGWRNCLCVLRFPV